MDAPADPAELLDQIEAPKSDRQPGYPNLLRGFSETYHSNRSSLPEPINGKLQTDAEQHWDRKARWHSSKVLASLTRWAMAVTSKDRRSFELSVLLYLIGRIGWNPNEADYLTCENITHKQIAEGVGCKENRVTKVLAAMRKRGLLTWEYVHWSGRKQRKCCRYTLLGVGAVMDGETWKLAPRELERLESRLPGLPAGRQHAFTIPST